DGREMLRLLAGRTRRMHNLIEGVLQYSRIGRVVEREREVDLNRLVQDTIESLALPENIHITLKDKLPTVVREQTRIGQVFQNLLGNAIKFMDKPEGRISIGCVDKETYWLFSVADNGPGIAEKYHTKIFQMFQTLTPRDQVEGTGIGLALVKKIIEKTWGGQIRVESTVGEGSTFYFTLPKRKEEK
ncbi:MAG: PAS domain-containing sensor histidine kinase, partial [Chloroflexi bacterium]|nr:PAS domain-containing sensor histidine kinase [Chloroflexota bacterium]